MRAIYLGLWDNALDTSSSRLIDLQRVIDMVEEYGKVRVSFDYQGRTRHASASHKMKRMIIDKGYDYEFIIDDNYGFRIYRREVK